MALNDKYFVIFDTQGAGDATAGYVWENKTGTALVTAIGRGPVETCRIVEVSSKLATEEITAQEAVNAVRKAYGDGMLSGKMKVVLSSNLEEKAAV